MPSYSLIAKFLVFYFLSLCYHLSAESSSLMPEDGPARKGEKEIALSVFPQLGDGSVYVLIARRYL